MKPLDQADRETFRLIILTRDGSQILLRANDSQPQLPSVAVLPGRRIAPQLAEQLHRQFGLRAYCLLVPRNVTHVEGDLQVKYAIMESLHADAYAPGGTCWMTRATIANMFPNSMGAQNAIKETLRQLDSHGNQARGSHCAKPGWLSRLFEWVQAQILPLGRDLTGDFNQLNASPDFSLIRFETTGPAVWFKATGAPNTHELPLTVCLAHLFPQYLPKLIGTQLDWNAWLSEEAPGATLDQFTSAAEWESVATHLAQLQILSVANTAKLLAVGCKDLTLPRLTSSIAPFLASMSGLMDIQQKKSPPPLSQGQLDSLGEDLHEACSVFRTSDLPVTLGHIDFNSGNVIYSPDRCVFLDWAEGCVTNPLITFEFLREYFRRSALASVRATEKVTDAYIGPWRSLVPLSELARAMTVSPLLAVLAYAVTLHAQNSTDGYHDPTFAGLLRSLTRRMYQEAARLSARTRQCLA